jgi:hypothetical protein
MGQKWIIDVLADLRSFAEANDLPLLASQLDNTALVARAEIASLTGKAPYAVTGDGTDAGIILGTAGAGRRA